MFYLYRCIPFTGEVVCVWHNVDEGRCFVSFSLYVTWRMIIDLWVGFLDSCSNEQGAREMPTSGQKEICCWHQYSPERKFKEPFQTSQSSLKWTNQNDWYGRKENLDPWKFVIAVYCFCFCLFAAIQHYNFKYIECFIPDLSKHLVEIILHTFYSFHWKTRKREGAIENDLIIKC